MDYSFKNNIIVDTSNMMIGFDNQRNIIYSLSVDIAKENLVVILSHLPKFNRNFNILNL